MSKFNLQLLLKIVAAVITAALSVLVGGNSDDTDEIIGHS